MNTQSYLFENKETIPDGLYVDLMNKLKLDFDTAPKKKVPYYINMLKSELLINVGQHNRNLHEDTRTEIVHMDVKQLRKFCKENHLETKKRNPEYTN